MQTRTSRGFNSCRTSQPRPSFSRVPGLKFSTTMSEAAARRLTRSRSSGWPRFSFMSRLLRDCRSYHSEVSVRESA